MDVFGNDSSEDDLLHDPITSSGNQRYVHGWCGEHLTAAHNPNSGSRHVADKSSLCAESTSLPTDNSAIILSLLFQTREPDTKGMKADQVQMG
jgi:hypothetical protein